jgi:hypothetical protein
MPVRYTTGTEPVEAATRLDASSQLLSRPPSRRSPPWTTEPTGFYFSTKAPAAGQSATKPCTQESAS